MSIAFKKSLFGFNCDDVLSYIEKTHKALKKKKAVLDEQIDSLKGENNSLRELLASVTKEKAEIESQLKEYTDKYDEIERLSKNIGKLYLVAKSNAQAIMKAASESADIARNEVEKNISLLDNTHRSLSGVKENIVNTSAEFANKMDDLTASLDEAREKIGKRETVVSKSEEDYRELIKVLSHE